MANLITITLPVRAHLQKYAVTEFSSTLTFNDPLGIIVYILLTNASENEPDESMRQIYTSSLSIELEEFRLVRKYCSPNLDRQGVVHLDTVLDKLFKRDLFKYVAESHAAGVYREIAIEKFCEQYKIYENEISFEALKKAEYRFRNDKLNCKKAA